MGILSDTEIFRLDGFLPDIFKNLKRKSEIIPFGIPVTFISRKRRYSGNSYVTGDTQSGNIYVNNSIK